MRVKLRRNVKLELLAVLITLAMAGSACADCTHAFAPFATSGAPSQTNRHAMKPPEPRVVATLIGQAGDLPKPCFRCKSGGPATPFPPTVSSPRATDLMATFAEPETMHVSRLESPPERAYHFHFVRRILHPPRDA